MRLSLQPARKLLLHEQRHSAQPKELFKKKHPGVQSRHLVDRVQDESIHLGCPDSADAVIGPETAEAERLGTLPLVPGMPTEICLATAEQTALACMAKPVMHPFQRALRVSIRHARFPARGRDRAPAISPRRVRTAGERTVPVAGPRVRNPG